MKENGKEICRHLKEVRQQIATENDIPLEQHECSYDGPCDGTCPRCEAEVRYLENELHRRMSLGRVATVASVAVGLTTLAACYTTDGEIIPEDIKDHPYVEDTTSGATPDSSTLNTVIFQ